MSDLAKIHSYYVYSLAAYTKVFYRGIDLVTDRTTELDDEGNELPVKVVELTDEELAARCIVLTQRLFLKFSELQLWEDGVGATARHRGAVDTPVRAPRGGFATVSLDTGTEQVHHADHVQLSEARLVREG